MSNENACEPTGDTSVKSDLPGTSPASSGELTEIAKNVEGTSELSTESTSSNVGEVTDISEEPSKEENDLPSDSQREVNQESTKSTTDASQGKIDYENELQNDSIQPEKSSVVENQTTDENQILVLSDVSTKTNEAEPATVQEIPEKHETMAETVTENSKVHTSGEVLVSEGEAGNANLSQVAADEKVKSSHMYPKLDSIAREAGIYVTVILFWKDFHTASYINYTCITVLITLFQKRIEFDSQTACMYGAV